MYRLLGKILLIIAVIPVYCYGQETDPGPGYQVVMMNNPALTGTEGDGTLRLSYLNFFPGNNYNLHSVFFSYDSYIPALHGGAGFYLSDDYLGGIINDMRGGFSYSYFLQAGKDLFINAGLSASFFYRGFNFDGAILPDQINPLGGVSETSSEILASNGQTVFDVGVGFLFITGKLFGGFSITHLAEPDLSGSGFSNERLKRRLFMHIAGDLDINSSKSLRIRPLSFLGLQGGNLSTGAGAVLESNSLSVNTMMLADNRKNLNMQTGFSFKGGKWSVYYNYRFNIVSGNILLPISLLHQTGLVFSLNSVDKRNSIKTINFPKL